MSLITLIVVELKENLAIIFECKSGEKDVVFHNVFSMIRNFATGVELGVRLSDQVNCDTIFDAG